MKQKMVIKVAMNDRKSRSKVLKIAVSNYGVESVALTGQKQEHVEVVGEGVDAVELTRRLRKKVAHAELVSVRETNIEHHDNQALYRQLPPVYGCFSTCHYESVRRNHDPSCTIM